MFSLENRENAVKEKRNSNFIVSSIKWAVICNFNHTFLLQRSLTLPTVFLILFHILEHTNSCYSLLTVRNFNSSVWKMFLKIILVLLSFYLCQLSELLECNIFEHLIFIVVAPVFFGKYCAFLNLFLKCPWFFYTWLHFWFSYPHFSFLMISVLDVSMPIYCFVISV
jgi:hypothetical protein